MPKPIDDQPLVMWKVFGACAVHCLAIWWVWAPTSNESRPFFGSARRTASIAACAVNVVLLGRSAAWNALTMARYCPARPSVGARRQRGKPHQRRIEVAGHLMHELHRGCDVDRFDIDLQERDIGDPSFVLHFDGVVAEPDDQVGAA